MRRQTISFGESLAATAGVLLIASMPTLTWFEADVISIVPAGAAIEEATNAVNAFQAFAALDFALLGCGLLLVAVPVAGAFGWVSSDAGARVTLLTSLVAVGLVVTRLLFPPGRVSEVAGFETTIGRGPGIYAALVISLLALVGGYLAVREVDEDARALRRAAGAL